MSGSSIPAHTSMKHKIVILDRTKRLARTTFLAVVMEKMLETEDQPPSHLEILITDEAEIQGLNADYRGVDAATDVLSFPSGDGPEIGPRLLGEVVVCLPIAERQAAGRGVSIESEVACLAVHGGLHLLGYDDTDDSGRLKMIEKMNSVVGSCGFEISPDWGSIYNN